MTRIIEEYKSMQIAFIKTNNSGNLTLNSNVNFSTTAIYNNTSGTTINSDNIILSSGHYLIECCLGISNSNSISNYANWNITVDNVEQDTKGSSTQDNKVGIDGSVAAISFTGTKTIRVKITDLGGTCSINNDYSYLLIKKVDL
tara:strand:- start:140 stop:571 length:432 start_codon:yes stop_codon:yes gene_type:complete